MRRVEFMKTIVDFLKIIIRCPIFQEMHVLYKKILSKYIFKYFFAIFLENIFL